MDKIKGIPDFKHDGFNGFIGVCQTDISPPIGIYARSWGAAAHDTSKGIHKPLLLTCVMFQTSSGSSPFILLSADLGVWRSARDGEEIRSAILKEFSIPASQLMFCLTHTHAGPVLSRDDSAKPGGALIDGYLTGLHRRALEAIHSALGSAVPAVLSWNYGKCQLAANRDLEDPGEDRIITGFNPGGRADDTLLVGRITDANNKIIAVLVNYACHPTTLAWENELTSPDYIGAMREVIKDHTDAPCLFLQGASGELAPRRQYVADPKVADTNGRELGFAVLATLENMLPPGMKFSFDRVVKSGADLGIWQLQKSEVSARLKAEMAEVTYQLKPMPSLSEIEQAYEAAGDRVTKERLWRQRSIRIGLGDGDTTQSRVWVWRVGDGLLIGQPNEAYSEFQLKLRSELPGAVAVINLVNGSAGYLAPRGCYHQRIYQVWQSPFAAGSLEQLYEKTLHTAKNIRF